MTDNFHPVSSIQPAAQDRQLGGDEHLPLYRRLRDQLAAQIASGAYKPGEALPGEIDLSKRYQLAPGTVRKAIEQLVIEGLVERRHGAGTFVRRPNFDNLMVRFFLFRDTMGGPLQPESRILSRRRLKAGDRIGRKLQIGEHDEIIHMVRLRCWDGAPRLIEDIYLPYPAFSGLLDLPAEEIGPLLYPAYEQLCGQLVCFIEEEIEITDASQNDREVLHLADSELVVAVERTARDASNRVLEWRLSRGEARRFKYRIKVR